MGHHKHWGHGCYCGPRHYPTKEERLESLKEYKEALEKETEGVKERIKELEKAS